MRTCTIRGHCGLILLWLFLSGGAATARGQVALFADDFDAGGSGTAWTVLSHAGDYTAEFTFDYSTRGIPPAPNSVGGSTVGAKFTVNNNAPPAIDALSAFPNGQNFAGDYALEFDLWINYNGGAGGGEGSTEFATAGINHTGTETNWASNPNSDGFWFAVTGEGGDSDDYRAYREASLLSVAEGGYTAGSRNHTASLYQSLFPSPTYETAGAPGKHWVEVRIAQTSGRIEWWINGTLIASRTDVTTTSGNIMIGHMDTYSSIAQPAIDSFIVFDNVRVVAPDCNSNGTPDALDIAGGTASDCNNTGVPDECEPIGGGDHDIDGDVDLTDFGAFVDCLGGPGSPPAAPGCASTCLAAFDFDDSSTVGLEDFAAFQQAYSTGPIPPRPSGAATGSEFVTEVMEMSLTQREQRIVEEVTAGNLPDFLRGFVPIEVSANIGGTTRNAVYHVMPDYLCIGSDDDFVRMPMTPLVAQPIADTFECLLTTRKMVNDIYSSATVKLAPSPINPQTTDITLVSTFYQHHLTIEAQREGNPLGELIGGIKKDVVITPLLASNPNRVAIYGWHQLNGVPIQPLYLGHVDFYVDYSHGIRLVRRRMWVDGVETTVADVLADPELCVLLSDEGVVANPSY